MVIGRVLAAWRVAAGGEPDWPAGVDNLRLANAERLLGRALPNDLKAIYRAGNGMGILDNNLVFEPLGPGENEGINVVEAGETYRQWNWSVPEELVIFGGNGQGDAFGLWLPKGEWTSYGECPVVSLHSDGEPPALGIFGTSLVAFLRGWSVYYLQLEYDSPRSLDLLEVPKEMRRLDLDEEDALITILRWADPKLPMHIVEPYEQRLLTPDELREAYGASR